MAKLDIPYLTFKPVAGGGQAAFWQPSPLLRKAGWKGMALGTDVMRAVAAAQARNVEVETWRLGGAKPRDVKRAVAPATMGALIDRYRRERMDDEAREKLFLGPLSDETKRQYAYAFRKILFWAEDGRTRVADITDAMCKDLKTALLGARNAKGELKRHGAVAILRILRLLMNYATDDAKVITSNPMSGVDIPTPTPRSRRIGPAAIVAIQAAARSPDINRPDVAFGISLGLWMLQREADILSWTRGNWRHCTDMAEESRRVLAGADGRVMGIRMRQAKTKTWVEVPATPQLRAEVEAEIAATASRGVLIAHLVADPDEPRGTPKWKFQRGFRAAVNHALALAAADGDDMLVEQLTGVQFRDLRRTGMCLLRELGLTIPYIANLSGHSIEETTKILETYMPTDPRASAAAIAMLTTRLAERAAIDAQQELTA